MKSKRWFLAAFLSLVIPSPCHAHFDGAGDYDAATKLKGRSAAGSSADFWDQLARALMEPAFAYSNSVHIYTDSNFRYVESNGIPDHATGQFPNRGNPNTISEQDYDFRMPIKGAVSGTTTPLGMNPFGVAVNGVPFDPGANEFWNRDRSSGWQYEAMSLGPRLGLDSNNAHVQPNGAYHYHGPPVGLIEILRQANRPVMIGYAADGFPIYGPFGYRQPENPQSGMVKLSSSYRLKEGTRPSGPGGSYDGTFVQDYEYAAGTGDLDECNGRVGVTPEFPQGTYYYVVSDAFPYIPRYWKGAPDQTFQRRPPPGGRRGMGAQDRPGFGSPGGGFGPPGFGPPGFGPPGPGGPGFGPGGPGFGPPPGMGPPPDEGGQ